MSVNLEIHVGLWIPKSVPYTAIERLAQIAQGGLAAGPELLLGHHDPHRPPSS